MSCSICHGRPNCPCCGKDTHKSCPDCDGVGYCFDEEQDEDVMCKTCDGDGIVEIETDYSDDYEPEDFS